MAETPVTWFVQECLGALKCHLLFPLGTFVCLLSQMPQYMSDSRIGKKLEISV